MKERNKLMEYAQKQRPTPSRRGMILTAIGIAIAIGGPVYVGLALESWTVVDPVWAIPTAWIGGALALVGIWDPWEGSEK